MFSMAKLVEIHTNYVKISGSTYIQLIPSQLYKKHKITKQQNCGWFVAPHLLQKHHICLTFSCHFLVEGFCFHSSTFITKHHICLTFSYHFLVRGFCFFTSVFDMTEQGEPSEHGSGLN